MSVGFAPQKHERPRSESRHSVMRISLTTECFDNCLTTAPAQLDQGLTCLIATKQVDECCKGKMEVRGNRLFPVDSLAFDPLNHNSFKFFWCNRLYCCACYTSSSVAAEVIESRGVAFAREWMNRNFSTMGATNTSGTRSTRPMSRFSSFATIPIRW